jgi:predicted dehydrogenase
MGHLFFVEGDYLWGRVQKLTNGWRKDMDFYSIVYGAAVHMIDLILWLSGARPIEVHGYGNKVATADSSFKYDDFAAVLMKFEGGMIAKVSASGGCVHPHFHKIIVYGTKKTFVHDILGASLYEDCNPKVEPVKIAEEYPGIKNKSQVIVSFIQSIVDPRAKPVVSCDDVFSAMSVCFAADKSIQEGRPSLVEYI